MDKKDKLVKDMIDASNDFETTVLEISKKWMEDEISSNDAMDQVTSAAAKMGLQKLMIGVKLSNIEDGEE